MSVEVGILGGLSIDHLVSDRIGARFNCLGGPGFYAALGARLIADTSVRLATRLPRSTGGFTEVLAGAGVDLTFCTSTPDVPRVWILTSAHGRRLVPVAPPSGTEFATADELPDAEPAIVPAAPFFDGLSGILYCAPDEVPRPPAPVPVGVDPDQRHVLNSGYDYWRAITADPGVLLPSRVQLASVAPDPRAAAIELASRLGVNVVARLDVDGMFAVDATGDGWVLQDNGVEVVETTGAGDSSAGAIIAALAAGTDLATAAAFGISTARIVLSDWGHRALAHADPLTRPLDRIRVTRQSRRRPRRQTAGSTMSTARANLDALIGALSEIGPTGPAPATTIGNALFVGSGDSLAACLLAQAAGQHAASAGDVAWTGGIPPRIDTVVGVSHSGRTAATVEALNIANQAGLPTIAITVHTDSALARIADRVVTATDIGVSETIPAAGYLSLALAVLATLGVEATGGFAGIGDTMKTLTPAATGLAAALPPAMPTAISVLSLPDLRSAGDFWSLKLIEATGLPVRSLALEEAGHVDYFIGPQSHLTLQLIGQYGHARHSRLAQALAGNGHTVLSFVANSLPASESWQQELSTAALGAYLAEVAAHIWCRPPFRNGEVPMDAQHIQLADGLAR